MSPMRVIDGSQGEGGGQVLRTSLALSALPVTQNAEGDYVTKLGLPEDEGGYAGDPILGVVKQIDLGALPAASTAGRYREIPRFPATARDIALLAPLTLGHGEIESVLQTASEPLLAGVELFDVFTDPTGAKIPADKKSLAYSLTYRSPERTLTADEVNTAHTRLKDRLRTQLAVSLRE